MWNNLLFVNHKGTEQNNLTGAMSSMKLHVHSKAANYW